MNILICAGAALVALAAATPAKAEAAIQPPMNTFNQAFYTCDGGAFTISYDSETPTSAKLTTSNSHEYELNRAASPTGVQFSNDRVSFWTDRKSVKVQGTQLKLLNCKTNAG